MSKAKKAPGHQTSGRSEGGSILFHPLTFHTFLKALLSGPYPQDKVQTASVKFQWPSLINTDKSFSHVTSGNVLQESP